MTLVIIAPGRDRKPWVEAIQKLDPSIQVEVYPEISDPEKIESALVWKYTHGTLAEFKNLKWVSSMGAGVDHILSDNSISKDVVISRIVDGKLSRDIKRTAAMAVLAWEYRLAEYVAANKWERIEPRPVKTVGVLGLGEMGKAIALTLYQMGYEVKGYSRTHKDISGVTSYYGSITNGFLQDLDILINVLPLTSETENILNRSLFERIKPGAYLINLGRGLHLVEDDLISSIKNGHLSGAWLDVFRIEPLPDEHPFWKLSEITVMPHTASITDPYSASAVVVENYHRLFNDSPLLYAVRRENGY